jgi:hypothetical protein
MKPEQEDMVILRAALNIVSWSRDVGYRPPVPRGWTVDDVEQRLTDYLDRMIENSAYGEPDQP